MPPLIDEYILVELPDKLNIRNISNVYDLIHPAMESGKSLLISIPKSAEADLSFIQLIESARIRAKTAGTHIVMSSPAEGAVLDVLERGGFAQTFSPEDKKFWLHEEAIQ
ncbi:STAS domain-containing protein [Pararhizobium sp. DWP1-1-3]|uniref:STAS domain-containing protein n=1 Tax=Pararhizobium sp. DWP1-1-3 TaxID=2804652 RepID=UPI003CED4868